MRDGRGIYGWIALLLLCMIQLEARLQAQVHITSFAHNLTPPPSSSRHVQCLQRRVTWECFGQWPSLVVEGEWEAALCAWAEGGG